MNWKLVFALSSLPAIWGIYAAEAGLLGVDAGKEIVHLAGWWGIFFLTLTLSATPLLRVFKKRHLMQHRRQLGLWTLLYSLLHLSYYLLFLLPSLGQLPEEVLKRPYILVGMISLIILVVLGITSTQRWQRRLKSKWLTLHKAVYAAAILIVIHWFMTLRSDYGEWILWTLPLIMLLGWRLSNAIKKRKKKKK